MNDSLSNLLIFAYIFIGIAFAEALCQRFLPTIYYRYGIPLFQRKLELKRPYRLKPCANYLQKTYSGDEDSPMPPMSFLMLHGEECAFWTGSKRNKTGNMWEGRQRSPNFAHGFLKIDTENNVIIQRAYVNWIIIPFFILWFIFAVTFPSSLIPRIIISILGIGGVVYIYAHTRVLHKHIWGSIETFFANK